MWLWYFKTLWSGSLTAEVCVGEEKEKSWPKKLAVDSILQISELLSNPSCRSPLSGAS